MSQNVDTVGKIIGDWGPWQLRAVILIYLCKIPSAWFMASIVFTAPIPIPGEVSCIQPEHSAILRNESILNDFCVAIDRVYDNDKHSGHHHTYGNNSYRTVPCTAFQYNMPFETTVSKFNLVCSNSILVSTSQFFHLLGALTGGLLAAKLME